MRKTQEPETTLFPLDPVQEADVEVHGGSLTLILRTVPAAGLRHIVHAQMTFETAQILADKLSAAVKLNEP